jgi:hypothetical protein
VSCLRRTERRTREKRKARKRRKAGSNESKCKKFHIQERETKMCFDCKEAIADKVEPIEEEFGQKVPKPSKIKTQEICIKCQNSFHPKCFNTKATTILCHLCEQKVKGLNN